MKIIKFLTAAAVLATPFTGYAQSFSDTVSDATDSDYTLSNSAAWAYYGTVNSAENFVPVTGALQTSVNAGNFSAITGTPSQSGQSTATSYNIVGGGSSTDSDQGTYVNTFLPNGATFTSTLFSPSEVFNLYLTTYQANAVVDVTVTNALGATVGTDDITTPLALPGATYGSNVNTDGLHGYGDVAVTLNGFQTGDTVSFLINAVPSNNTVTYWATGLSGVTADAVTPVTVPEPSTYMLLGVAMLSAILLRRSRARV